MNGSGAYGNGFDWGKQTTWKTPNGLPLNMEY